MDDLFTTFRFKTENTPEFLWIYNSCHIVFTLNFFTRADSFTKIAGFVRKAIFFLLKFLCKYYSRNLAFIDFSALYYTTLHFMT